MHLQLGLLIQQYLVLDCVAARSVGMGGEGSTQPSYQLLHTTPMQAWRYGSLIRDLTGLQHIYTPHWRPPAHMYVPVGLGF